ncbi:hypothetical protein CEXT_84441 [Caerostris extrusa]|uniref:Uncharacterized protein n=1 Tax=Caerostris extrusa TaxID=172846 RepID=A0AAV4MPC5_CAEEX|nr:hypothetical protein CEXT_84441 [Caerostris extrusa]
MNHSFGLDLVQPCNQVTEQALDNIRMQQTKWTLRDRERCQCASAESRNEGHTFQLLLSEKLDSDYDRVDAGEREGDEKRERRVSMVTGDGAIGSVEQEMRTREEDAKCQY